MTGWDFDFRGHKLAGDWQAALGVTCRVHHLTWTSMAGEAKRDYPASIGSQSPWYREYPMVEDYFARVNAALKRGKPMVKIGVIHPIESYWLYWGTKEQTQGIRDEMEERFGNVVKWLLYGLLDFDFLSESLLLEWQQQGDTGFTAGEMCYDAILVPGCVTLRSHTLKRLEEFADRGGRIVFAGEIPQLVDGAPDEGPARLAKRCQAVPFSRQRILESLEPERLLDIRNRDGRRSAGLLYQMRQEGERRILFLSHSEKSQNSDLALREEYTIQAKGFWNVVRLRPEDGSREPVKCERKRGGGLWQERTVWTVSCYEHDSFLYLLTPEAEGAEDQTAESGEPVKPAESADQIAVKIPAEVPVLLDEPNVLVLDLAEYAFDDGPWQDEEEILRIDNQFRRKLGFPVRTEAFAQPWVLDQDEEEEEHHSLRLRFSIHSACEIDKISLAIEWEAGTAIFWDGVAVEPETEGWYVDRDLAKFKLPPLGRGDHRLEVILPFHRRCHVEAMYLLGDFGVALRGKAHCITEPVRKLGFGDICMQGLPFYGGTVRYQIPVVTKQKQETLRITASDFRCPVIGVSLDGEKKGTIACAPYELLVECEEAGEHVLELAAFGNRRNTFGPLHNCNRTELWIGPDAWRTEGASWAYEYQLKPTGILKGPDIVRKGFYDSVYRKTEGNAEEKG